jgi:hypothetical protein
VDDEIQAPEPLDGRDDEGMRPGGGREVAARPPCGDDLPPLGLQPLGDRSADAARAAGDERVQPRASS